MAEFEIVSRDRWGSRSRWKYGDMKLPATAVYLHHSVTATTDFPFKDMKKVEDECITRFGQFCYSYGVHRSGVILEGAGTKTGTHIANRNSTSFGIVLIGDYDDAPNQADVALDPTPEQIESVRWLIYHLKVEKNWLVDGAILRPHLAVSNTACPGNNVVPILDQFREVWVPPAPPVPPPPGPPPVVVGTTIEVDMKVTNLAVSMLIDPNGKGWLKIPYPFDRVLSIIPHSVTRPAADGRYDFEADKVAATPEDNGTIIVVQGGTPGTQAIVWVRVITE